MSEQKESPSADDIAPKEERQFFLHAIQPLHAIMSPLKGLIVPKDGPPDKKHEANYGIFSSQIATKTGKRPAIVVINKYVGSESIEEFAQKVIRRFADKQDALDQAYGTGRGNIVKDVCNEIRGEAKEASCDISFAIPYTRIDHKTKEPIHPALFITSIGSTTTLLVNQRHSCTTTECPRSPNQIFKDAANTQDPFRCLDILRGEEGINLFAHTSLATDASAQESIKNTLTAAYVDQLAAETELQMASEVAKPDLPFADRINDAFSKVFTTEIKEELGYLCLDEGVFSALVCQQIMGYFSPRQSMSPSWSPSLEAMYQKTSISVKYRESNLPILKSKCIEYKVKKFRAIEELVALWSSCFSVRSFVDLPSRRLETNQRKVSLAGLWSFLKARPALKAALAYWAVLGVVAWVGIKNKPAEKLLSLSHGGMPYATMMGIVLVGIAACLELRNIKNACQSQQPVPGG